MRNKKCSEDENPSPGGHSYLPLIFWLSPPNSEERGISSAHDWRVLLEQPASLALRALTGKEHGCRAQSHGQLQGGWTAGRVCKGSFQLVLSALVQSTEQLKSKLSLEFLSEGDEKTWNFLCRSAMPLKLCGQSDGHVHVTSCCHYWLSLPQP